MISQHPFRVFRDVFCTIAFVEAQAVLIALKLGGLLMPGCPWLLILAPLIAKFLAATATVANAAMFKREPPPATGAVVLNGEPFADPNDKD